MTRYLVDVARRGHGIAPGASAAADSDEELAPAGPRQEPSFVDAVPESPGNEEAASAGSSRSPTDAVQIRERRPASPERPSAESPPAAATASATPSPSVSQAPLAAARSVAPAAASPSVPPVAVPAPAAAVPAPATTSGAEPAASAPIDALRAPGPPAVDRPGAPAPPVTASVLAHPPPGRIEPPPIAEPHAPPAVVEVTAAPPPPSPRPATAQVPTSALTHEAVAPAAPVELVPEAAPGSPDRVVPATPPATVGLALGSTPEPAAAVASAPAQPSRTEPVPAARAEPVARPPREPGPVRAVPASGPRNIDTGAQPAPSAVPVSALAPTPKLGPQGRQSGPDVEVIPASAPLPPPRPIAPAPSTSLALPRPAWLDRPPAVVVEPPPAPRRSVQVRIGSVEVRAEAQPAAAPVSAARRSAARGFDEYWAVRSHAGWDL